LCRMPVPGVSRDFFEQRQKRQAVMINDTRRGVALYYSSDRRARADVYVLIKMDGITQNVSSIHPDVTLQLWDPPNVHCPSTVDFEPHIDKLISIKVSRRS